METKTKSYTRRAVDNYRAKKDNITLTLEKGTRERLERITGENAAGYIRDMVYKELQRLENGLTGSGKEPTPDRLQAIESEKKPTPDADEVQKMIDEKRKQYEREKEEEKAQEDTQKTRLFNMSDYK